MGKYSRILFSALLTLCLIKQSQPSPVPKYSRSIITGRDHQSNDILFRDFESSAFDSGQNGIEPLTPRRKFANRFLPKNQEVEVTTSRTYMDKILFSDGVRPNRGYIRRFPAEYSQAEEILNLRSLYPIPAVVKFIDEENQASKDFQLENDMPSTTTDATTPAGEIPSRSETTFSRSSSSSREDERGQNQASQHLVPLGVLEKWMTRNNSTENVTPSPNPPCEDPNKITFLSLFRVPDIQGKSDVPCPKNLRRNHHGDCVRPVKRIRFRIIEEVIQRIPEDAES